MGLIYILYQQDLDKRLSFYIASNIKRVFEIDVRLSYISPINIKNFKGLTPFPEMIKLVLIGNLDSDGALCSDNEESQQLNKDIVAVDISGLSEPDFALFAENTAKKVNHSLGHAFGLRHCDSERCVMSSIESFNKFNSISASFCYECTQHLKNTLGL